MSRIMNCSPWKHLPLLLCILAISTTRLMCQTSGVTPLAGVSITPDLTVAVDSLSCAPSNDGLGHLVCLEAVTTSPGVFSLMGVGWVAPPAPRTTSPETAGHLDKPLNLANPAPDAGGEPRIQGLSCTKTSDDTGTVICAVAIQLVKQVTMEPCTSPERSQCIIVEANGESLYGIAFNPAPSPVPNEGTTSSNFVLLESVAAGSSLGNPSCTASGQPTVNDSPAICEFTVNGHAMGVVFDPRGTTAATTVSLLSGTTFEQNVSCTTSAGVSTVNAGGTVAVCASVVSGNLVAFQFDPRTGYASTSPVTLGPVTDFGNPSCGTPASNATNNTANTILCAIVTGSTSTLEAAAYNPVSSTASGQLTNLGAAPSGSWTGGVSCVSPNPANGTTKDTVTCAATTTTNEAFGINFDLAGTNSGFLGSVFTPSPSAAISTPSCIALAIDNGQISCAAIVSGGSFGFNVVL
jgi:hypothetical protein